MAQQQFYTLQSCDQQATERKAAYAASVVHLGKSSYTPTGSSSKTDLTDNEADYDSYAAFDIAAFLGPVLAPGTGFMILSPQVLFLVGDTDPVVGNTIGYWWLEDSGGVVRMVGVFDTPLPMEMAGQSIPLNIIDLFPTGYVGP